MKPKLLRASVLGFLVGCIIVYVYCYYVSPIVEMQSLLQESNRDKQKIIDLEEMVRRKDDSLDVFKLDLKEREVCDRMRREMSMGGEPDTLDSLEGE
jgi:hypothetical protein